MWSFESGRFPQVLLYIKISSMTNVNRGGNHSREGKLVIISGVIVYKESDFIGVAPNMYLCMCILKIVHIQGKSHNVEIVYFDTKRDCS